MERKLYRSANDRILGGVCGGIGEYFAIDPVIIRLLWVIFTLVGGAGLIAYIIAAIIVPANPAGRAEDLSSGSGERDSAWEGRDRSKTSSLALGIILVAFGVFVLVKDFIPWMHRDVFLAVVLVGLGIFFIIRKIR
jgi:phage shock protein C